MDMNAIRRTFALPCILASLFAVTSHAADRPVTLHAILPLSGPGAFLGTQEKVAMQIGEKLIDSQGGIRGRPVHFVFHDDQSKPQVAVQLLQQILPEKPSIILGAATVANCNAMMPIMANGPVMYCLSPTIRPDPGSYIFTSNVSTEDANRSIIRYFRMRGLKRIGLVTATDAMGQLAEKSMEAALKLPENADMTLVGESEFNPTDINITAQLVRLKAAKPDALLAWNTGAPIGTVFKGLVDTGFDVPVATNYGNMTYVQMKAYAGFLPKDLYFPSAEWVPHPDSLSLKPGVEAAQKDFFAQFAAAGVAPDVAHTMVWDPMMIVVAALRSVGPDAGPAALRDALLHFKSHAGVNGAYDFEKVPQRGLSDENVVVSRWNAKRNAWDVVSRPTGIPLGH
jgi:branched-chain amino acid transport system substrate-binding protein